MVRSIVAVLLVLGATACGGGAGTTSGGGNAGSGGGGGGGGGGSIIPPGPPGSPVLFFSDLASGPREGNTDTSLGQSAGVDGAIVTVWGRNLGASQGSSTISCGGAAAAAVYAWGNATAPANLYASHGMQAVSFQVSHLAGLGAGSIAVTIGGVTSNAIPFTVRSGAIRFVRTDGDDVTGTGSWGAPWRTILRARTALAAGDVAYLCDGVSQTAETDFSACVNLDSSGTASNPKALVAYPGASVIVGTASIQRAFHNWDGSGAGSYSSGWTIAKLNLVAGEVAVPAFGNSRVVGNRITAPSGNGAMGAIHVLGNSVAVLGNELTNIGSASCSKLYHAIYVTGERRSTGPRAPTESDREIGWNYLHDNLSNRAINVYSEEPYSAFLTDQRVHDNVIVNQRGDGILIGYYVTGENRVWNNLVVEAGLGPDWVDDSSTHAGIRLNAGHEQVASTTIRVYHNTIYGGGYPAAVEWGSGMFLFDPEGLALSTCDVRNNLVRSTSAPYMAAWSGTMPALAGHNLWFGAGAAPAWDTAAASADPLLVNPAGNDFRLQAGSPAVDAGASVVSGVVTIDLDAQPRPLGAGYDVGCYERVP